VCQPKPAQIALKYGCLNLDKWVAENTRAMRKRHDHFVGKFCSTENSFELTASGSFFAWIRHPWANLSGRQAARKLADEANLICLPGEACGPGLEPYLRLAFGNIAIDQIPTAIARFGDLNQR
ncbi:MAG: aminotransferase class I/II-fold pyridoxal phosphate-dependent enzyme, partial [Desulfuromonadales bacterium]|nr:aminotransferase class I/II-fold pyridoxal phosphate-dependent enzyme [Desulfuromonadales bacterium]